MKNSIFSNNKTNQFAMELKRQRRKARLTQRELAYLLDINLSTYKAWESGRALPNNTNYSKLMVFVADRNNDVIPKIWEQ